MIILDGGMGTQLQAQGLKPGETPEDWNMERPEVVSAVHRAYARAGADIVYANTFGANRFKYHGRHSLEAVIRAGIACARQSGVRVALDVGPTGKLLKPAGDLDFEAAVTAFADQIRIGADAGADLVVIETMSDLYELKAAVVAAKESCSLPVYATVAVNADGHLLTGGSAKCVAALLESLGVDAYGFNCGLGPEEMLPMVEELAKLSTNPIIAKPNAGLPHLEGGKTVFKVGPAEFGAMMAKLVDAGAAMVGGCCGTTPEHIEAVGRLRSEAEIAGAKRTVGAVGGERSEGVVASGTTTVALKPYAGVIIGERINPTGKKLLKEAFRKGDTAYVLREAVKQVDAGAQMLDVNCGVPGIDEAAALEATVEAVQSVVTCPLQIDTADPEALKRALRRVNGKALVNSVNGKRESMEAVFPLVKKYGGMMVALCLDERGIPATADGRLEIARRILAEGEKWGFGKKDFVFDALTLAVSAQPDAAIVTLETVKRLTAELGVNTVLGVSNVSFGLPDRPTLNNAMYTLAKRAGLSAAIANPAAIRDEIDPAAEAVLLGKDQNCAAWIAAHEASAPVAPAVAATEMGARRPDEMLKAAIGRGLREDAARSAAAMLAAGAAPMEVVQTGIVPALEEVGKGFEQGRVFLPQLLMAADAAGDAFAVVRKGLSATSSKPSQPQPSPIILATVKGDVHDIGKNIVRALLENYGFEVVDLGRDVPPERIVAAAQENRAMMVGLSALMTTTVGAMAETIRLLKEAALPCRTVVGGAVVTEEYAASIGADYYAKDAMRTVRIAEELSAE